MPAERNSVKIQTWLTKQAQMQAQHLQRNIDHLTTISGKKKYG
jgi:hypothetical protein